MLHIITTKCRLKTNKNAKIVSDVIEQPNKKIGSAFVVADTKFGGKIFMVHRADRLVEVITELKKNNVEPKKLQLVCSGEKEPYLFITEVV